MRFRIGLLTIALLLSPASPEGRDTFPSLQRAETGQRASLSGHVLPALDRAIKLPPTQYAGVATDSAPLPRESTLTLTIVLNRDDPEGFGRFVREVQDPRSPNFRRFASQDELARRFGPSREAYDRVLAFLEGNGFALVEGSANRLTLTARGTRGQGERAFGVRIDDYRMHGRSFFANDRDPVLPSALAPHVQAVIGLSNLARPRPNIEGLRELCRVVTGKPWALCWPLPPPGFPHLTAPPPLPPGPYNGPPEDEDEAESQSLRLSGATTAATPLSAPRWLGVSGSGQTIGLLQFDTFKPSDVADWLAFTRLPADRISRLSQVHVNGGAPAGANQAEVLLDIAALMTFAPGAHYVVYDAPFSGSGTSFQSLFNAMINGGVTVISNSWAYCEDQTTLADVTSIDSILAAAAASGIGVFNASGDTGSTCLDGSPDTVAVPAGSPNGTAVGGTSLTVGPGFTYGGETYWNGTTATPPTGQGGFGLSRFFGRPAYQDGLNGSPKRSVPDVAVNADPARGIPLCQADAGGCPNGLSYGGTSVAAPIWAAFAALLNEAQGQNLGNLNPLLYPLANTPAFHTPASMGSDFQRVGLGSPNLNRIHLALLGQSAGPVDPTVSEVFAESNAVPAEGATETFVVVRLRDADGNSVSGKTVALSASAGASAVISPPSGVTTVANGAVVFAVKSTTAETVTFTATDVTDGIVLQNQPVVEFTNPPVVAAGMSPATQSVPANGIASGTITVTLRDALGRGAVGKVVSLSQGNGHSSITGPAPAVTDSDGQVSFSVSSRTTEMVTYRAFDVTDGNLEVPVTAAINFVNGLGAGCPLGVATAAPGYSVSSFATGFALSLFAGQCRGPTGLAFDSSGNLLVMGFGDGVLYKFGPTGGVASGGTRVSTLPLPTASCPYSLAWSKDGQHLYLARQFCGGSGDVVELNPATGQITRTVASGIVCADGMATDPVTGDLFVAAPCPAAPASVVRISNPQSASPTVSTYSTPGHCDTLTFGPDGTLYSMCYLPDGIFRVTRIAGTSSATPGAFTYLATLGTVPADGIVIASNPGDPSHPPFVLVNKSDGNIVKVDLTKSPPVVESVATGGSVGDIMVAGPDGCAYAVQSDRVLRIANADGTCPLAPSSAIAQLSLSPSGVSPDPAQGSAQTFTARLLNASPAPDARVTFVVTGANPDLKLVRIGSDGTASFTHVAAHIGTDSVVATTTSGAGPLTSNAAEVTWTAGKHVTFLTLNPSPTSGMPDAALTVTAALADVSQEPPAKVSGAAINFTVAGASCVGVTDANGLASCNLTPTGSPGNKTLTAAFGGNAQYTAATAATAFVLVASNESGLSGVGPAHIWVGLKNSDDVGTQFDLQVKVLIGSTVVAQGQTLCVTGLARNPDKAKQVVVPLALVGGGGGAGDDVLRVRISTRVGTTPQGARCAGPGGSHASARGLRLYYDGAKTPSSLGLQLAPDALDDFYLDSNGGICANLPSSTATTFSLEETAPGPTAPKCRDSGTVNFANGNPWQLIGTWSLPMP